MVFRTRNRILSAACITFLFFMPLQQGFASKGEAKKNIRLPYTKKRAARIEDRGKAGVSCFSSVVQALHGVDYFKKHHSRGRKNRSKKAVHLLVHKLDKNKKIKANAILRFMKLFEKEAKKSLLPLRNSVALLAHFILTQCDVPPVSRFVKLTMYRSLPQARKDGNAKKTSVPIMIPSPKDRVFFLPVRSDTKPMSLAKLLKLKRTGKQLGKSDFYSSLRRLNITPPPCIKKTFDTLPDIQVDYEAEFTLNLQHEESVPKILPIYLDRMYIDGGMKLKIVKTEILPSKTLEFPLENNPSKKARFALVSMVGEFFKKHNGERHYHPYSCILTKEKKHVSWVFYDNHRIRGFKNPKKDSRIISRPSPAPFVIKNLHKHISRHGTLFLYQFVGFKETPAKKAKKRKS